MKAINTTARLGMYFLLYHIPLDFSLLYEAQKLLLDGGIMVEVAFIYLIFNLICYKGVILKPILKPIVTPILIAAHHVNGHLPSLEIDNIFSDENEFV